MGRCWVQDEERTPLRQGRGAVVGSGNVFDCRAGVEIRMLMERSQGVSCVPRFGKCRREEQDVSRALWAGYGIVIPMFPAFF